MQKAHLKIHWKVRERKRYKYWKKMSPRTRKKMRGVKEKHYRDPESRRQYPNYEEKKWFEKKEISEKSLARKGYGKKKYWENPEQKKTGGSVEGSILPEVKENLSGCLLC